MGREARCSAVLALRLVPVAALLGISCGAAEPPPEAPLAPSPPVPIATPAVTTPAPPPRGTYSLRLRPIETRWFEIAPRDERQGPLPPPGSKIALVRLECDIDFNGGRPGSCRNAPTRALPATWGGLDPVRLQRCYSIEPAKPLPPKVLAEAAREMKDRAPGAIFRWMGAEEPVMIMAVVSFLEDEPIVGARVFRGLDSGMSPLPVVGYHLVRQRSDSWWGSGSLQANPTFMQRTSYLVAFDPRQSTSDPSWGWPVRPEPDLARVSGAELRAIAERDEDEVLRFCAYVDLAIRHCLDGKEAEAQGEIAAARAVLPAARARIATPPADELEKALRTLDQRARGAAKDPCGP